MNPPKLLLDENLSPTIAVSLRQTDGVDIVHVRDRAKNGASDADVFALAFSEDRIVVTGNVGDFEVLASNSNLHAGLVLIESGSIPRAQQDHLVRTGWALLLAEHQAGRDMVNRVLYISISGSSRFEPLP